MTHPEHILSALAALDALGLHHLRGEVARQARQSAMIASDKAGATRPIVYRAGRWALCVAQPHWATGWHYTVTHLPSGLGVPLERYRLIRDVDDGIALVDALKASANIDKTTEKNMERVRKVVEAWEKS